MNPGSINNMIDRKKLGKQSKRKGLDAELESTRFWSKELDTNIRRTPRSGAYYAWPGDLIDFGNSILKDWVVDRKFGKTSVPKKITKQIEKLRDESQGKPYFLEISNPFREVLVIIPRKHFARILKELQDFRKEIQ